MYNGRYRYFVPYPLDYSGQNVIFAKKINGHGQGTQKNAG